MKKSVELPPVTRAHSCTRKATRIHESWTFRHNTGTKRTDLPDPDFLK